MIHVPGGPEPLPVPLEAAGWTPDQLKRFVGAGLLRDYWYRSDLALLGAATALTLAEAEALYDRAQEESAKKGSTDRSGDHE